VILTCAGRAAAGVNVETCPKDTEHEEWRDACWRRECRRPEGLRLAQAESEGHWRAGAGRALRRAWGGGRRETRPRGRPRAWRRRAAQAGKTRSERGSSVWIMSLLLRDLLTRMKFVVQERARGIGGGRGSTGGQTDAVRRSEQ
jgi:hypothetical protein